MSSLMLYVINKFYNDDGILFYTLMTFSKEKMYYAEYDFKRLKKKVCDFYPERIPLLNSNQEAYTLLGKYMHSKKREYKYLICNSHGKRFSVTKQEILNEVSNGTVFTNMSYSNSVIRLKSASLPILNTVSRSVDKPDTVEKLCDLEAGTIGSIGVNKKFVGFRKSDKKTGVIKFALPGGQYDIINEVVCYKLGLLFGFDVAEASLETYTNKQCVISCYSDPMLFYGVKPKSLKSYIHPDIFRSTFSMNWLVKNFSEEARIKFIQMVMFDFLTRQVDRHISNIAFYKNTLYSLYDNGRSLFFDDYSDKKNTLNLKVSGDIIDDFHINEHGYGWLFLEDVVGYNEYKNYINNNVTFEDIYAILNTYYSDKDRATWTAKYIYKVYCMLLRKNLKG